MPLGGFPQLVDCQVSSGFAGVVREELSGQGLPAVHDLLLSYSPADAVIGVEASVSGPVSAFPVFQFFCETQ